MTDEMVPGPVDFVLVEFPEGAATTGVAESISGLLDAGTVRLYDIAVIRRSVDGSVALVDLARPGDPGLEGFGAFAGAQSGLFNDDDVDQAAAAMTEGATAVLLAYENTWAVPFVAAAHEAGGQLIASQRIPAQVLLDALEFAEAAG